MADETDMPSYGGEKEGLMDPAWERQQRKVSGEEEEKDRACDRASFVRFDRRLPPGATLTCARRVSRSRKSTRVFAMDAICSRCSK